MLVAGSALFRQPDLARAIRDLRRRARSRRFRSQHAVPSSSSTVRVRYAETDQMGVVYYANYFVWFEVARADLLRTLGMELSGDGTVGCVAAGDRGALRVPPAGAGTTTSWK